MAKRKLPPISKEVHFFLKDREAFGRRKTVDKKTDGDYIEATHDKGLKVDKAELKIKQYFYHKDTMRYVESTMCDFLAYVRDNNNNVRIEISDPALTSWIQPYLDYKLSDNNKKRGGKLEACSPTSVVNYRSHISKALLLDLDKSNGDIAIPSKVLPKKSRDSIECTKGFDYKENLENGNIRFWKTIGCRTGDYKYLSRSEIGTLEKTNGYDLSNFRNIDGTINNISLQKRNKDGKYCILVLKSKKSKRNERIIVDQSKENIEFIKAKLKNYDEAINLPPNAPIQKCRRAYAKDYYNSIKRDVGKLNTDELYICRGNDFGKVFDKKALSIVSTSLGHGAKDRETTIVHNYLD